MTVRCPHCSTEHFLPEGLLGSRGARVRCRRCGRRFEVARDGGGVRPEAPATMAPPAPDASDLAELPRRMEPRVAARQILDALEERLGARLSGALAEGRLWSTHGPEILRAFDAYRDALGPRADSAVFRDALRERWNVDLGSGAPS